MVRNHAVPIALLLVLAACSQDPAPPVPDVAAAAVPKQDAGPGVAAPGAPPAVAAPVLAIDGDGLRLFNPDTGAARPIPFGTARAAALAALGFRGVPEFTTLEECGTGPLDQAVWPDGLRLYFQDGKFAGWALGGRNTDGPTKVAITTASGIGPGSTRAELTAAYSAKVMQSTLGTEFNAGDLAGLLDGPGSKARITDLWAGASCNFR